MDTQVQCELQEIEMLLMTTIRDVISSLDRKGHNYVYMLSSAGMGKRMMLWQMWNAEIMSKVVSGWLIGYGIWVEFGKRVEKRILEDATA